MNNYRLTGVCLALILLLSTSCALNRVKGTNMLNKRSDYKSTKQIEDALSSADEALLSPERTKPSVADIWIHPHEMPSGDYFLGGWIRSIISKARWQVEEKRKSSIFK